eukprot:scaffold34826_cov111-Phaeocystis_antarctica.AAC.2
MRRAVLAIDIDTQQWADAPLYLPHTCGVFDDLEVEKLVEVAHMEEDIVEAARAIDFLDLLLHQAVDEAALRHLEHPRALAGDAVGAARAAQLLMGEGHLDEADVEAFDLVRRERVTHVQWLGQPAVRYVTLEDDGTQHQWLVQTQSEA